MTFKTRDELKIYHLERAKFFHDKFLVSENKRDWDGMINNQWAYSCIDFLDEEFFTERTEKREYMIDWIKKRILELTEVVQDREKKFILARDSSDAVHEGFYSASMEDFNEKIKMYSRILKTLLPTEENNLDNHIKVARAKEYPIDQLIHIEHSGFAKCLWHNDKQPSMKYYPKKNDVYCFSCHKYGDAIDVAMATFGCQFMEAVNKLN